MLHRCAHHHNTFTAVFSPTRYLQTHKLQELRDARPAEEVEEERAWKALRESQAVSVSGREIGLADSYREMNGRCWRGGRVEACPWLVMTALSGTYEGRAGHDVYRVNWIVPVAG